MNVFIFSGCENSCGRRRWEIRGHPVGLPAMIASGRTNSGESTIGHSLYNFQTAFHRAQTKNGSSVCLTHSPNGFRDRGSNIISNSASIAANSALMIGVEAVNFSMDWTELN